MSSQAFICPLTHEIMQDPWVDPDGNTYERRAIVRWLEQKSLSPITRRPMTIADLAPNRAIKDLCDEYRATHSTPMTPVASASASASTDTTSGNVTLSDATTGTDVTLVIDCSGSMSKVPESKTLENRLSIMALVRHAAKTCCKIMGSDDRLAIVGFSSDATVHLPLTCMTEASKGTAFRAIDRLTPGGCTNIQRALDCALDLQDAESRRRRYVLLLTDGVPYPRSSVGEATMLRRRGALPATVCTFGFGYDLDSKMLSEVGSIGRGTFAFIPDMSFVATIFVNAMAGILSQGLTMAERPTTEPSDQPRVEVVETLRRISRTVTVRANEYDGSTRVDPASLGRARGHLEVLIGRVKAAEPSDFTAALLYDLEGQIAMACESVETYRTWGRHFIRSFCSAHATRHCCNFKDRSVQCYATEAFRKIQAQGDQAFATIDMPDPEPKTRYRSFGSQATAPAKVNMRRYNDRSGGCFAPDATVRLRNGETRRIADVRPGDHLVTPGGSDEVEWVVRFSTGANDTGANDTGANDTGANDTGANDTGANDTGANDMRDLVTLPSGLSLTPWHPTRCPTSGEWRFPNSLGRVKRVACDALYNVVLRAGGSMLVNGTECATLGHGTTDESVKVLGHRYFGDRKRIVHDLLALDSRGTRIVSASGVERDVTTGRVIRIV